MKILVVCEKGVNRSVTIASQLKFAGHDTLAVGTATASDTTMTMLCGWAERILLTEPGQRDWISSEWQDKVRVWDVGPDVFPRPYNRKLLRKVNALLQTCAGDLA